MLRQRSWVVHVLASEHDHVGTLVASRLSRKGLNPSAVDQPQLVCKSTATGLVNILGDRGIKWELFRRAYRRVPLSCWLSFATLDEEQMSIAASERGPLCSEDEDDADLPASAVFAHAESD